MEKTIFVGKIILQDKKTKKILILKRSNYKKLDANTWDFPGGSIDFGEDCRIAIKREVKEETTLNLNSYKIIESYSNKIDDGQYIFILYHSNNYQGKIKLSKEHIEYNWINIGQRPKLYKQ